MAHVRRSQAAKNSWAKRRNGFVKDKTKMKRRTKIGLWYRCPRCSHLFQSKKKNPKCPYGPHWNPLEDQYITINFQSKNVKKGD